MKSMKLQAESHSKMARSTTYSFRQAFICLHLCARRLADKLPHHELIYICAQDLNVISTFSRHVPCRMTKTREVGQGETGRIWRKPCPVEHPHSQGVRCVDSREPGCRAGGPHMAEPPQWGDSRSCSRGWDHADLHEEITCQGAGLQPETHDRQLGRWQNLIGKESACSAGDPSLIPGSGRTPGEGKGYPLQYSGLEDSMDCIEHGVAKSQTRLSNFHFWGF